jgi:hypothetical protein
MNERRQRVALDVMRWTLALVVLVQAVMFLYGSRADDDHVGHSIPNALRLALGGSEVVAGLLFLLPQTFATGGWLLIAVFCCATAVHLAHGQFEVGALLVYITAVAVVLSHRQRPAEG